MTLLTIIDAVCDTVGLDRFASVYGSNDPSAQTMVEFAQRGGEEIARRVDWQKLLQSATILTSGANLPTDFQRLVAGGVRTATGDYARPVINSGQWSLINQVVSAQPYFFLKSGTILFSPVASGTNAILDYISRYWVIGNVGGAKEAFSADDDTTAFPERLLTKDVVWRWKRQAGLPYEDQLAEFEADLQQEINADRGLSS